MLANIISSALVGYAVFRFFQSWVRLRRNISLAKASGLPYHVSPLIRGMPTLLYPVIEVLWVRLLMKIPYIKDSKWPIIFTVHRGWRWGDEMAQKCGEFYLIVSPTQIYLNCCHPEGIMQLATRRNDFIKPQELYEMVDVFGPSIVSSDGDEWKRHRKVVAPAFAERSNKLVWEESLRQAKGLVRWWAREDGSTKSSILINDAYQGCAQLTLHVLSGPGFGVRQVFDGDKEEVLENVKIPGFNTGVLLNGHQLSFKNALRGLADGIPWLILFPKWLLERSPLKLHQYTLRAYMETQSYFEELTKYKSEISTGESTDDTRIMDLMAPLVKASQITPKESNGIYLTKQEVIADTWTLVFAGHETTANAFHYTLVFLASDLETQIELQRDIDSIVGERHQDTWTYEKDLPAFFNNFVGACIFETLRLMPPVPELPKVARAGPRPLTIGGKTYTVPQETFIHVDMGGAQRNPAYWPHSASKVRNRKDDMYDYVPQRWLINRNDGTAQTFSAADADGLEKASFEATSGGLFVPIKGSYLPFAEGVRSCPGRRFAQVELTAVLSSLLNEYSVEMDVSNFATDEEVDRMDMQERKAIYEKARARARHIVDSSVYQAAMRMPTPVQLRLVRRGNERFMNCYV